MLQPKKAPPPPASLTHADNFEPPLLILSRTNAWLTGQFLALQTRAAKLLLTELMQRQRELGKTINSLALLLAKPYGEPQDALELQKIGQRWWELLWLAPNAFSQTWLAGSLPKRQSADSKRRPDAERRISARVINFPERRAMRPIKR